MDMAHSEASDAVARRAALVLAAAQAVIGSAGPIAFSLGALAGDHLLGPDKSLATAPITGFTVGVAVGALPAAAIIRKLGQRPGFVSGTLFTALGGAVATLALFLQNFWVFVLGLTLIGVGNAFVQQFRFAAADNAPPAFKPRAISFVLAGGFITAIVGPQIVIFTREALAPIMFAGSFASVIGLAAIGALILSFMPKQQHIVSSGGESALPARPLAEIAAQPRFAVGMICGIGAYALMNFLMTGAPLAMVGCGFSTDDAALGISWHVMAMYGPSFFTGRLIQRFGIERVVAFGLVLLVACAAVALAGIALWNFWLTLILLGLGWNFAFIGATALVAGSYRPSERARAQGLNDFSVFGTVAFASLMSGIIYNAWGWAALNWIVVPVAMLCLVALGWLMIVSRREAGIRQISTIR